MGTLFSHVSFSSQFKNSLKFHPPKSSHVKIIFTPHRFKCFYERKHFLKQKFFKLKFVDKERKLGSMSITLFFGPKKIFDPKNVRLQKKGSFQSRGIFSFRKLIKKQLKIFWFIRLRQSAFVSFLFFTFIWLIFAFN